MALATTSLVQLSSRAFELVTGRSSTPDRSTRISFFRICLCHLLNNTSFILIRFFLHQTFTPLYWEERYVPRDMRDSNIVTLNINKGDRSDSNNYRGKSLLIIVGKVFSLITLSRLQNERTLPQGYSLGHNLGSRVGAVEEHSPSTNVARVRFPDSAS